MQSQIGRYQILGKLGEGAMGEVFRAHDPVLGRVIALKTLSRHLDGDPDLRKRFAREAQSTAALTHRNIVKTYEFGEDQGRLFIAMELLEGSDLRQVMAARSLDLPEKLGVMTQTSRGVAFAHARGVIHRDLKPANLHVCPDGTVKVMDFGLARVADSAMTATGMVMGTPNYMAPEQVRGEKVDARADVFALGVVFYEMLTGAKPFDAGSMHAVLAKVLQAEPVPLAQAAPEVPTPLARVIEVALAKDRSQRYSHAGELAQALEQLRDTLVTRPVPRPDLPGSGTTPPLRSGAVAAPRRPSPPVEGTAALAAASTPRARPGVTLSGSARTQLSRGSGTLSGTARTQVSRVAEPVEEEAEEEVAEEQALPPQTVTRPVPVVSSHVRSVALAAGVAAVVVLVGAGGLWIGSRRHAADEAGRPTDGTTQALVAAQMELATREVGDKDFAAALRRSEHVLGLQPDNAQAKEIALQSRAALGRIEAGTQGARKAAIQGRVEDAADELWTVLTLDPRQPIATELAGALDGRFRGRAEEARVLGVAARAAATAVKGSSLADFKRAAAAFADAEAAYARGDFVLAAGRFLESRDAFERARRAARG